MTTTDRPARGRTPAGTTRPLVVTVAIGLAVAAVAGPVSGAPAVTGVLVGLLLTCASLGLGSLVLAWVTEVSPAMSLVVALMTYTLQVVLLGAAYIVLRSSPEAREAVDGTWLGLTVIATTLAWLTLQVIGLMRSRQPYFDLPERAPDSDTKRDLGSASDASEVGTP
jgi:ATP synthase protein I